MRNKVNENRRELGNRPDKAHNDEKQQCMTMLLNRFQGKGMFFRRLLWSEPWFIHKLLRCLSSLNTTSTFLNKNEAEPIFPIICLLEDQQTVSKDF